MIYIERTQKVSIGGSKEVWCGDGPDMHDDEGHPDMLLRVDSENSPAGVPTKALSPEKHRKFVRWIGMVHRRDLGKMG